MIECCIDQLQQGEIALLYSEAEAYRLMFAEVGHLDVLQVTLFDQVMGGNGIAEKNIGLVERNGIEGVLVGRVSLDYGVGISGPYLGQWQVVIHHAQA
ncbi:hypothetical protein D3C77_666560 [compost metagenome]